MAGCKKGKWVLMKQKQQNWKYKHKCMVGFFEVVYSQVKVGMMASYFTNNISKMAIFTSTTLFDAYINNHE